MFQRLLPAIVVLFLVISYANILHCRGEDDIDFDPDEFAAPSVRQHQPLPTESSTESLDNSDDNEEEEEEVCIGLVRMRHTIIAHTLICKIAYS